ncbi:hypothetical protein ND816_02690 [Leptospira levettii]|uniref:hypothetical protein n=1 Tax=Leptospira levettii TaxID=2023178 RepID=UPI00223DC33D|nr:hypothetical protein [Leptospira levettii]MCW7506722.1 hypothetical protein [Leptospira levettii]MCW7517812.1 hypothetical protein [Leptospira levettii]
MFSGLLETAFLNFAIQYRFVFMKTKRLTWILVMLLLFSLRDTIPQPINHVSPGKEDELGLESQEKTVQVLGETKTIRVLYKPKGKKNHFAALVLETSAAYIPKLAEYLHAAPKANVLTIKDITDNSIARNEGSIAYVPFAFPDPELPIPAPLLYHEIGHWWFGQEPRWVAEGVSSFLPVAMEKSGYHSIGILETHKVNSWWGFRQPLPKIDFPLKDNSYPDLIVAKDFPIYYEKSFKIQYLIYLELGGEKYRKFLISLMNPNNESWHDYFIAPSKILSEEKTKGVISLLKLQKEINWDQLLAGWVQKKGYSSQTKSLLLDSDSDCIIDYEEIANKTDPYLWDSDMDGLGDFAENTLGTNPNEKNESIDFQSRIQKYGIILDGMDDDWTFLNVVTLIQPKLPGQKIPIVEFRYFIKDNLLYGMIRSDKPYTEYISKEKDLYFFLADNSKNKERVGFGFKMNQNDVYGWEYERTIGKKRYVWGKVGKVFEFQIDVSDHPDPELVLLPLINGPSGPSLGHWEYEKPIVIPLQKVGSANGIEKRSGFSGKI